ncbi:hypothetical protein [Methanorbis furvi]|uniref:Uncharacterized protein n=1 Tax=Methanorbis furvi TaxID=3028299 RepID=A0AAE4MB00_9EURY|nr:hypothetical protein [Methanocorpusculaceae archaeon Ag1]
MCGLLIFSAGVAADEEYWITIDPIPDQMLGSTYIINGETNLPIGSRLLFEHVWTSDKKCRDNTRLYIRSSDDGVFSRVLEVQKSTGDTNIWYTSVDTSRCGKENNFTTRIYFLDTTAWNKTTYNLIIPSSNQTQTPGFGLGILVLAFTTAVVMSLLRKK